MNYSDIEILLVEDNPHDAELTRRALKKGKITNNIHTVTDGEEALDYLFSRGEYLNNDAKPKVILLDLKLPKVNGLQVLKEIRCSELTRNIPVVVLTSSNEEKDIVESYKLGVNSYIVKPVEFEGFMKAVSEIGLYWLLLNKIPV
ncbi:MAG: response regulator [Ignavibacteriae bacterium]|nr:MAG: response regulator [Ignavibacteriota bacterium]